MYANSVTYGALLENFTTPITQHTSFTTSYYIYNIHISFPPQVITLVAVPSYLTIYLHMSSNLTFHVISSISTTILTVSTFGDGLNGLRTQVGT